jgi:membrane-associated phospholipid phosphatase
MKALNNLTEVANKITGAFERMIHRIRRIRPVGWLLIISVMFILFVTVVPPRFWRILWIDVLLHRSLLGMLLIFCLIAVSLVWSAGQRIDSCVFTFFNMRGRRPRWLDRTMLIMTEFGNGVVTLGLAVVFYFAVSHILAYKFVLGTLTLWSVVETMKVFISRARPYISLEDVRIVGVPAKGKSFPSGHTSQAFYTVTLLTQYFHINFMLTVALYLLALLVGVTRMYMGMHYPRDVLAGAILGTFWGLIGSIVNTYIFR